MYDQAASTQDMSFPRLSPDHDGYSYSITSPSSSNLSLYSTPFDLPSSRVRKAAPVPIPNLTKKSRGRRVPTISDPDSDGSPSGAAKARLFRCMVAGCGKCFLRGEHLKRHVRSIHTHDKPYKCAVPLCGKSFSRRDNLVQHLKIHKDQSDSFSPQSLASLSFSDRDDASDSQRSSHSPADTHFVPPSFDLPPTPPADYYQPNFQYPLDYTCDRFTGAIIPTSSLRSASLSSIALDYEYAMSNDMSSHYPLLQTPQVYPQQALMTGIHSAGDQFQLGEPMQYFYH